MNAMASSSNVARFGLAFLSFVITFPNGVLSQSLDSLTSLSELIAANPPINTVGNVNIVKSGNADASDHDHVAICYMPYLARFSIDGVPDDDFSQYDGLVAIALAMEHLNTGNGTIISELDGINERCPLRFTTRAFDTETQLSVAVDHVISLTDRGDGRKQKLLPCGIIGALYSSISIPTSIISSLRGFPQISPASTSIALDDKSQHKYFGRLIPNDDATAVPLLAKFNEWGVSHFAVLHVDDAYGNGFANGIRFAAQKYPKMHVETVAILFGASRDKIKEAIRKLKETGFTYFFGVLYTEYLIEIMTEAYDQGIAGTGKHTWLFGDAVGNFMSSRSIEAGSPLEKVYRGTGVLSAVGGSQGKDEVFDKFIQSMQQLAQNEKGMSYLNAHLPQAKGYSVNHSIITDQESFLDAPGIFTSFAFDIAIALGIAACELAENSEKNEYFTGEELYRAFLNTTFAGTTGSIVVDPNTGTRDPKSALFLLTNFVKDDEASVGKGMMQFKGVQTDLYRSGYWERLRKYTFNDGSSDIPLPLPSLETKSDYTSIVVKGVGSVLCTIIISLSLGFSWWTYRNSKKRVVSASQPIFLHFISAGTLLMGSAIIPFTIDLGSKNKRGATATCMAFPWLLPIGFSLTFSALFTKTHRVNKIMKSAAKFKRLTLTARDVMKPMITLLVLNVLVLTIWTAIDPLQHQTVVVAKDKYSRAIESYDICHSDHAAIFVATLCVINLGSLTFAVFEAYRARNLSTELQESSYIFRAMTIFLLTSFLGIPVILLTRDDMDVVYFVAVGMIFALSTSILLLIFAPKVRALRNENNNTDHASFSSSAPRATGIAVMNMKLAHAELEKEVRELKEENHKLKQENKTLLSRDDGRLGQWNTDELEKENCRLKEENHKLNQFQGLLSRDDERLALDEAGNTHALGKEVCELREENHKLKQENHMLLSRDGERLGHNEAWIIDELEEENCELKEENHKLKQENQVLLSRDDERIGLDVAGNIDEL